MQANIMTLCRTTKNLQKHTLIKDSMTADGYYLIPFKDKDDKITYYMAEAVHRGEKIKADDKDDIPKYSKPKNDYMQGQYLNERYLHTGERYIFITERTLRRFKY